MQSSKSLTPVARSIEDIGARYKAWLVDVWGVMHDGLSAYPRAVEACRRFREQGGLVLLLSNSPRPSGALREQLSRVGVPGDAYDATVTSGDLSRSLLSERPGARVFHLGPDRDKPIFHGLDIALAEPDAAELVLCSGLFDDETETPEDYRTLLGALAQRGLPMICANPDHMVERGRDLVYCAGALAALFAELGGEVVYAGKPHLPIYALAMTRLSELAGRSLAREEVLAIGDGVHTDMKGAAEFGVDSVFIASRLHLPQSGADEPIDGARLAALFAHGKAPVAAMEELVW